MIIILPIAMAIVATLLVEKLLGTSTSNSVAMRMCLTRTKWQSDSKQAVTTSSGIRTLKAAPADLAWKYHTHYHPNTVSLVTNKTGRVIAIVSLKPLPHDWKKTANAYDARFLQSDIDLIQFSERVIHHEPQAVDIAHGRPVARIVHTRGSTTNIS